MIRWQWDKKSKIFNVNALLEQSLDVMVLVNACNKERLDSQLADYLYRLEFTND